MRYTEQTAVRLDKETTAKLGKIAEAEDRSVSSVIRRMVADAVAAYKLPTASKPSR
jgi:predicted transcriptional regulator